MAGRFSVEATFRALDDLSRPVARMSGNVEKFARRARRSMGRLDRSFGRAHQTIARTGRAIGATAVATGVAVGVLGKRGAEFEQAITNVGAVSLQTRAQIAPLEELALRLGATTKFTATEAANAMEVMAKQGFSAKDIIAGVPGVLSAAAASGLEIAEVADHVGSALKGMGEDTSKATDFADILALASSRTNSTIGTLGESIRNVASTARELKVPFTDVVASVALLQDVGLDASVAGSALNTMLTKLAKPPAAIAKQMKRMGLSFKRTNGDMKSLPEVLDTINQMAAKAGGNFDRVALLADLVGLRGQKAASNLATLFESKKLQELTAELGNATGKAKEMADLRMDTLTGDITLLGSAVDSVLVSLFGLEGKGLRGVVQATTKWVDQNKALIVSGVKDFLSDVRDNLPQIVRGLKLIGGGLVVFYTMAAAVKVAQTTLAAVELATKGVSGAIWLFKKRTDAVTAATKAYAFATRAATAAQVAFGTATSATSARLVGMRGALNASRLGTAINGVTGKLGKAGLLGAALGVGYAFGTWLDHKTGISQMIAKWAGEFDGLNETVADIGRTLGLDSVVAVAEGNLQASQDQRTNVRGLGAGAQGPEVVNTTSRTISSEIQKSRHTESQSMEVTIRDETGRAEVTRGPRRGAGVVLQPSGVP